MDKIGGINMKKMSNEEAKEFVKNPSNRKYVAVPVLLIVSLVFYILSLIFLELGGGDPEPASESSLVGVSDINAADKFSKIQMALRIMPSHKTEGNMLLMVAEEGAAEWSGEYDDDFADSITNNYFKTDNMEDYFPEFHFNENTVPLGNAKPFCMHLDWSTKANRKVLDKYYAVQDMPLCQLA